MDNKQIIDIIKENESPMYIFDMEEIENIVSLFRQNVNGASICYAMKANPFITPMTCKLTDKIEVCSPGEYEICIRNSIDPSCIIVSGVNKTYESIAGILDYSKGKGIYTIESLRHYEILSTLAQERDIKLNVIIRLSSGNQFGVDKEEYFEILDKVIQDSTLEFIGVHYFSGTQKKLKKISKELDMLEEFGNILRERYGFEKLLLEYGPGLYVNYFNSAKDEECQSAKEQLSELSKLTQKLTAYSDVTFEMGRFIASMCGYFVTKVIDTKKNDGVNYLIVDGGIHQLNYYGQMMGMKHPYLRHVKCDDKTQEMCYDSMVCCHYNIVGSLCTANDVIVRDIELGRVDIGDYLIFERCGAYSVTEGAALFLSRELPTVVLRTKDGAFRVLREKTETNLFNAEMIGSFY